MKTLSVDPHRPADEVIQQAVEVLQAGGICGLPTETFYGLAVDPFNPEALVRLNELKGKPTGEPVLLLAADSSQVAHVAGTGSRLFRLLAHEFWPGPLTLVLPMLPETPDEIAPGRGTVAVRVPGLALPRLLAARLGRPISGVSANLHDQPPCHEAGEVAQLFPEQLSLVLDGGSAPGKAPSSILDLTGAQPKLLREGAIPAETLERFLH